MDAHADVPMLSTEDLAAMVERVARVEGIGVTYRITGRVVHAQVTGTEQRMSDLNAFLVQTPQDVRALVGEVARLRAEHMRLTSAVERPELDDG